MRKLVVSITASVTLGSFGAACGEPNVLTEGEVLRREYDDPDEDRWWSSQCVSYDPKTHACTFSIPVEHVDHDGPHWYVDIRGVDKEGKWREETHEVTQTLYDIALEGVYLNLNDGSIVHR